ncbi:hypothetical protein C8Q80DRAFT_292205 [Daedaleopsis nitida]|nr:hypothetical protein C8Q80DRAFT_292205 [Daedaleopsis nitida]
MPQLSIDDNPDNYSDDIPTEGGFQDGMEPAKAPSPTNPLSQAQERKIVDYLEDHFLDITRNYKKRSDPSSNLTTLAAYLEATHHMLSLILQIPPVDPSAPLRTSFLLRLTGEVLQSVTGYVPDMDVLPVLLAWLTDLDRGWLAVLRSQAWDADACVGVDAALPEGARASPMSQTERARLRSLLLGGRTGSRSGWRSWTRRAGGSSSRCSGSGSSRRSTSSSLRHSRRWGPSAASTRREWQERADLFEA